MLTSLIVPIVVSAVALFFASFLSWTVLPLHVADWKKLENEDGLIGALTELGVPPGNYMFPGWSTSEEMKSDEYQQKYQAGPAGILTIFATTGMARKLVLTFVYFLVVSFCVAYLATLALPTGSDFMPVFRFVSTASLLAFLTAIVQHAIWFNNRIVGHVVESIAYAAIVGAIFAAMWPAA